MVGNKLTRAIVNEILGEHNVDKQMTDNKGDVSTRKYPLENYDLLYIG